mgnify:FL=1|tara:strand:- start:189 stop:728 length:540 start_codon:yes stop_codon:yes gene_type:complete
MSLIAIEKNVLPNNCVKVLKNILCDLDFKIAQDSKCVNIFESQNFQGFSRNTLDSKNVNESNKLTYTRLNDYAFIIAEIVCKKLNFKIKNINRIMWNLYKRGEEGLFHTDATENNFITILYSLNTSDGYIMIDEKKVNDVENEAKIFKSIVKHKGVGPTKDLFRLNLNIVLDYEELNND